MRAPAGHAPAVEPLFEFRLSLTLVPNITLTYGASQQVDAPEDVFAEQHDVFNFEGHTGDIVVVTVTGDVRTQVTLYDANGAVLGVNEETYSDPYTLQETLNSDGTYIIHVDTDYFMGDNYEITIVNQADTSQFTRLEHGEAVTGVFEEGGSIEARFTGEAGDMISLELNAEHSIYFREGTLTLLAPDKQVYTFSLEYDPTVPISHSVLPMAGEYSMRLTTPKPLSRVPQRGIILTMLKDLPLLSFSPTLRDP